MKIKMRAGNIILACRQYETQREAFKVSMLKIADSEERMWMDIRKNSQDEIFYNLKQMALYAEQSEYPYLIINQKEFNIMEKYL
jgi:hypothetical protein